MLVGLEPVGALPDPTRPVPAGFFGRLGAALGDVHRLTFFRTLEMSNDFQREGVLAALVATIGADGWKRLERSDEHHGSERTHRVEDDDRTGASARLRAG